jgi:hypothetical protein
LLARPTAADLKQTVYDGVQIHLVLGHSCGLLLALLSVAEGAREDLARVGGGREARSTGRDCPALGVLAALHTWMQASSWTRPE